jgi:deoxycytidylate deaminase
LTALRQTASIPNACSRKFPIPERRIIRPATVPDCQEPHGQFEMVGSADPEHAASVSTSIGSSPRPEIVIGLVRAIGTDLSYTTSTITKELDAGHIHCEQIHLADLLSTLDPAGYLQNGPVHVRYRTHMDVGDDFRVFLQRQDAIALLGVQELRRRRVSATPSSTSRGTAYLVTSLMAPGEVATLHQIYGPRFFLISIGAPELTRRNHLARSISGSVGLPSQECGAIAVDLMNRDVGWSGGAAGIDLHPEVKPTQGYRSKPGFRVDVNGVFPHADVFLSSADRAASKRTLERFIDLLLSNPFHTPSRDEMGMYVAYGSARRSASLSRRVGAAICSPLGDVIAVGTNETPRFGGGQHWAEEEPDDRDFQLGYDSNDRTKREMLQDFLLRLRSAGWLKTNVPNLQPATSNAPADDLVQAALTSEAINHARFFDITEYGRSVHAEMAAITDAARRGVSVNGATLYCTTFCCHDCAKHIVASGITRVVYIEAYPKSRVAELQGDSIGLVERVGDVGNRVRFEPFVGISPSRFNDLFSWLPRKQTDASALNTLSGDIFNWMKSQAPIRNTIVNERPEYLQVQEAGISQAERNADTIVSDAVTAYNAWRATL